MVEMQPEVIRSAAVKSDGVCLGPNGGGRRLSLSKSAPEKKRTISQRRILVDKKDKLSSGAAIKMPASRCSPTGIINSNPAAGFAIRSFIASEREQPAFGRLLGPDSRVRFCVL